MEIKKGIGVSPGVVISTAIVLDAEDLVIPKRHVDEGQVPHEIQRFEEALNKGSAELFVLRDEVTQLHGKEIGSIFDFHLSILRDKKSTIDPIVTEIKAQKTTAEYAVSVVMRRYASTFASMTDRYFSERVKDIYDIERRLLRHLIGQKHEDLTHLTQDVEVIAHDLLPSQTAPLDKVH